MGPTISYQVAWKKYRVRARLNWLLFFGYMPVVGILGYWLTLITGSETPVYVLAVFWMTLWIVAANWALRFPCPRCGKAFFAGWYVNPYAGHCLHCGLRKWGEVDDGSKAPEETWRL